MKFIIKHKPLYYLIQFTWGALMNLVGALVFFVLVVFFKKKPVKRFNRCWFITIGKKWGGVNFGLFSLVSEQSSVSTTFHEAGHGVQNMVWGPLYPFVIAIPSVIRYWYRKLNPNKVRTSYDSIWFEGQATTWGYKYYKLLDKGGSK